MASRQAAEGLPLPTVRSGPAAGTHGDFFERALLNFSRHSRVGSSSGSGVACGGRIDSGTCRRFTRMRVHVEDRPRIESIKMSSSASSGETAGYFAFHRSRPARAASFCGEFAIVISGIFSRGAFLADVPLEREGAT